MAQERHTFYITILYISSDHLFKCFRPGVLKPFFLAYHYMKFNISVYYKYFLYLNRKTA